MLFLENDRIQSLVRSFFMNDTATLLTFDLWQEVCRDWPGQTPPSLHPHQHPAPADWPLHAVSAALCWPAVRMGRILQFQRSVKSLAFGYTSLIIFKHSSILKMRIYLLKCFNDLVRFFFICSNALHRVIYYMYPYLWMGICNKLVWLVNCPVHVPYMSMILYAVHKYARTV